MTWQQSGNNGTILQMKKFLGIVVLGLMLSSNAYANLLSFKKYAKCKYKTKGGTMINYSTWDYFNLKKMLSTLRLTKIIFTTRTMLGTRNLIAAEKLLEVMIHQNGHLNFQMRISLQGYK